MAVTIISLSEQILTAGMEEMEEMAYKEHGVIMEEMDRMVVMVIVTHK